MMDTHSIGTEMYQLMKELYPICRSITGDGVRETLQILREHIPLEVHEVASGTQVFDWVVPKEWNIRDAYIKNAKGEKIVDFQKSNLHIMGYSVPIKQKVKLSALKEHLFSLPDHKDWIPHRTSYYKENWGFCITHHQLESLADEEYEVFIDSSLEDGHLTYGEYYLQGEVDDEFLISCHTCHPALANDNLSGVVLATFLAKTLSEKKLRYSYRFLFIPTTIGSITWLSLNEAKTHRIKLGLVVACVGDSGKMHYKKTRQADAEIDMVVDHCLRHSRQDYEILEFSPYGYDERQYCSPGFNLPVGSLTRTTHGLFPENHTSADNLEFIDVDSLVDSYSKYMAIIDITENNKKYINTNPKGEPQLGKRGLYSMFGGKRESNLYELALLWVLNLSDGNYSLLHIANRSELPFSYIKEAASKLLDKGLLKEAKIDPS
jgi:aminopeptidase-like protein